MSADEKIHDALCQNIDLRDWELLRAPMVQLCCGGLALGLLSFQFKGPAFFLLLLGFWCVGWVTSSPFLVASIQSGIAGSVALYPLVLYPTWRTSILEEAGAWLASLAAGLFVLKTLWARRSIPPEDRLTGALGEILLVGIPAVFFFQPLVVLFSFQNHVCESVGLNAWDLNPTIRLISSLHLLWDHGIASLCLIAILLGCIVFRSLRPTQDAGSGAISVERYCLIAGSLSLGLMVFPFLTTMGMDGVDRTRLFRVPEIIPSIDYPFPAPVEIIQWLVFALFPAILFALILFLFALIKARVKAPVGARETTLWHLATGSMAFCLLMAGLISLLFFGVHMWKPRMHWAPDVDARLFRELFNLIVGVGGILGGFWLVRGSSFFVWKNDGEAQAQALADLEKAILPVHVLLTMKQAVWNVVAFSLGYTLFLGPQSLSAWLAENGRTMVSQDIPSGAISHAFQRQVVSLWETGLWPIALFLCALPAYYLMIAVVNMVVLQRKRQENALKKAPSDVVAGGGQ